MGFHILIEDSLEFFTMTVFDPFFSFSSINISVSFNDLNPISFFSDNNTHIIRLLYEYFRITIVLQVEQFTFLFQPSAALE